ncbi:FG-GAP repeat protein, partial [bacterium]|nr:FG-GAP repeat protein [bacterium]
MGVWGRLAALLVLLSVVLAVAGPSADAQADWSQLGVDIDGEAAGDFSGFSVAMNAVGDTVIIGAIFNNGNGNGSGQARVFTLTDGVWDQVGADIDGENERDNSGYSVAMNAVGDTVIIGAYVNDGNGDSSGHARVFTLTDGGWVQVGVDIDGEAADDQSGLSVAMNAVGDTVIIGAPDNDGNGDSSGQARVFTLTDGGWVQVGVDIDGEAADDESGLSVAMNAVGDTV